MKLLALDSTNDGRITKGKIYDGVPIERSIPGMVGIRILVYDDKRHWMTFNPDIFMPAEGLQNANASNS